MKKDDPCPLCGKPLFENSVALYCSEKAECLEGRPSHFAAYEKIYHDYITYVPPYRIKYLFNKKTS
jgi:hypothetical protein